MKYLIAIAVLAVLIAIYTCGYILNNKISKPENCKDIDCNGCKLTCNKRSGEYVD